MFFHLSTGADLQRFGHGTPGIAGADHVVSLAVVAVALLVIRKSDDGARRAEVAGVAVGRAVGHASGRDGFTRTRWPQAGGKGDSVLWITSWATPACWDRRHSRSSWPAAPPPASRRARPARGSTGPAARVGAAANALAPPSPSRSSSSSPASAGVGYYSTPASDQGHGRSRGASAQAAWRDRRPAYRPRQPSRAGAPGNLGSGPSGYHRAPWREASACAWPFYNPRAQHVPCSTKDGSAARRSGAAASGPARGRPCPPPAAGSEGKPLRAGVPRETGRQKNGCFAWKPGSAPSRTLDPEAPSESAVRLPNPPCKLDHPRREASGQTLKAARRRGERFSGRHSSPTLQGFAHAARG